MKVPILRTEFEGHGGSFRKTNSRGSFCANDDSFIGESVMLKRIASVFDGPDELYFVCGSRMRSSAESFERLLNEVMNPVPSA
jgi:hypothetical protein